MIKYIVCAVLIAIAWTLVLVFSQPLWWAAVATVVVLLILLTIVLVNHLVARRAAKAIEDSLGKQASEQLAQGRPDLQAEIQAMQSEFVRGVEALKRSQVGGKSGAKALYALPWYVMIGPPGSGKTTAIRNCGLDFPYLSDRQRGGALQGVGGTRNCDWWMSNQAILIDTAGRYSTQNEDRDEWLAFLDLLKKYRPSAPINGVLVTIPVSDVGLGDDGRIPQLATDMRARIDEITARLDVSVPIYLLLTKCDLIPGFVETFAALDRNERNQIWGFTLPVQRQLPAVAATIEQHFDELVYMLADRTMQRLTDERNEQAKPSIYAFSQHVAPIRNRLAAFVSQLCAHSIYGETPRLRGVYLTSGTQEGNPIDRLMAGIAAAMSLPTAAAPVARNVQVEARSYFLGDVFSRVIFPDRYLARRSQQHMRKQQRKQYIAAGGLATTAVAMAVFPSISARKNSQLQSRTSATVQALQERSANGIRPPITLNDLTPLLGVSDELARLEDDGPPFSMQFGMYQGDKLATPTRELLLTLVRDELAAPLVEQDSDKLRRFADRHADSEATPTDTTYRENFALLRRTLHLGHGETADGSMPALKEESESKWLQKTLTASWEQPLTELSQNAAPEDVTRIAEVYTQSLALDPRWAVRIEDSLVRDSRRVLRKIDQDDAVIWQIVEDVSREDLDITLRTMMNTSFVKSRDKLVRGAFTRKGWEKHVRARIDAAANATDSLGWVLGQTEQEAKEARRERLASLRSRYYKQYIEEWQNFIGALHVDAPTNYVQELELFTEFSRGSNPPLPSLFEHVRWNANLPEAPKPKAEEAADSLLDAGAALAKEKLTAAAGTDGAKADLLNKALADETPTEQGSRSRFLTEKDVASALSGYYRFGASDSVQDPADGPAGPEKALAINDYQALVIEVRDALRSRLDDPTQEKSLINAVKAARTKTETLISDQDPLWQPRFRELLWPPFDRMATLVEGDAQSGVQSSWCNRVYLPFNEALSSRYPFDKSSRSEASLADITRILHPDNGELWKYQTDVLSNYLTKTGNTFTLNDRGTGSRWHVSRKIPDFLSAALDVTRSLFPHGRPVPFVEFEVMILPRPKLSEISLSIDGQSLVYRNTPETWEPMTWPGEGDSKGASLRAKGFGLNGHVEANGEWGLLRLLEQGKVEGNASSQVFTVNWDLSDQGAGIVTIKFRLRRSESPFFGIPTRAQPFLGIFRNSQIVVPPSIVEAGKACSRL